MLPSVQTITKRTVRVIWGLGLIAILGVMCGSTVEASPDPSGTSSDSVASHAARIFVDGSFAEWKRLAPVYADPTGDAPAGAPDLGRIWMAHDDQFLFLRVEVGKEINLQEGNQLTLYLDTDNNRATGRRARGLGAEVTWTFGKREGQFRRQSATSRIRHDDIGLVTAPTVSSRGFEMALRRDARIQGQTSLFEGNTLRIALADRRSNGDVLPDAEGGLAYRLTEATGLSPLETLDVARPPEAALRVLSYNVEHDGLFNASNQPSFGRVLRTVQPDLMGFQEIYEHSATETQQVVASLFASSDDRPWHSAKAGRDLVAVSRYPIQSTYEIPGYKRYASAGFLINTHTALGTNLLFIVAHPPCCTGGHPSADEQRQQVVDGIVAFIRDAKTPGGTLDVAPKTPIIIAGDMNFVGEDQQPRTLRTGEIINTEQFGPPIDPDWDGSALTDLSPRLTGWPMDFTWYDPSSSFSPGRLDYMLYTDSVLEAVHRYVLFTRTLSEDMLSAHGLQRDDVMQAADHLPVVADFALRGSSE